MKIYELEFNFEVDPETGHQSLVYPTQREARKEARRLLFQRREDERTDAEEYGVELPEAEDTATLYQCTVVPISAQVVCDLINYKGGWEREKKQLGVFTLGKRYTYKKTREAGN